jgi:predicted transcriptional regulator
VVERDSQRSPAAKSSRERLLDLIRSQPGLHKSALCQETGLAWGTVDYHLRLLRRGNLVSQHVDGRTTRVFPADLRHRQSLLAALADEPAARIAAAVHQAPQRAGALSDRLGLSPKVVRRHLARLLREGLLVREGDHRPLYRVADDAHGLLVSGPRSEAVLSLPSGLQPR